MGSTETLVISGFRVNLRHQTNLLGVTQGVQRSQAASDSPPADGGVFSFQALPASPPALRRKSLRSMPLDTPTFNGDTTDLPPAPLAQLAEQLTLNQ